MAWLYQYWSLSININIIKRTKAYCYIRDQNFVHVDMPADLQMLLLDVPFDSAHATTGLSHYEATSCNNFSTILSCSKILGLTIHSTWKFVRTAVLGSQPATLSVALDSWCSEALYKTMLVWLLHHQSIIPCFIIFVTNHGVKSSPYDLVAKWQIVFIFWINLKSWYLVYCNPQKSPLESEIAPQIW